MKTNFNRQIRLADFDIADFNTFLREILEEVIARIKETPAIAGKYIESGKLTESELRYMIDNPKDDPISMSNVYKMYSNIPDNLKVDYESNGIRFKFGDFKDSANFIRLPYSYQELIEEILSSHDKYRLDCSIRPIKKDANAESLSQLIPFVWFISHADMKEFKKDHIYYFIQLNNKYYAFDNLNNTVITLNFGYEIYNVNGIMDRIYWGEYHSIKSIDRSDIPDKPIDKTEKFNFPPFTKGIEIHEALELTLFGMKNNASMKSLENALEDSKTSKCPPFIDEVDPLSKIKFKTKSECPKFL